MIKIVWVLFNIAVGLTFGRSVTQNKLSSANNHFGLRLQSQLSDGKSNVFISPFSISNAFAMLYSGAKGVTAQEMRQVLGYDLADLTDQEVKDEFKEQLDQLEMESKQYDLKVANKILVQKDFKILETYNQNVKNYFKSSVDVVDFAGKPLEVMQSVNQFVSNQTRDKITKLLDKPLDPSTRLLLLNAVYFEAKFRKRFDKQETHEELFYDSEDNQKSVKMMQRIGTFNYTEVPDLESSLLEIPYSGDDISLYILLPNQRQGLKELKKSLTDFSILENCFIKLKEEVVSVTIPKFKIETSYSLVSNLMKMGIISAFSGSADLSAINGQQNLQVSDVLHKAYVEMSEEGTKAAAVTGIGVVLKNKIIPPKEYLTFRADHPFILFIRNKRNGIVLFSGHINQL